MPHSRQRKKCSVYGFLDLELPGEYYKQLVYNFHEENKALKKNKMCGVMEDSSKGYSNYSINQQMVKDLKADLTFVKSKLKVLAINIEIIVISSSSEATSDNQSEGKVTKVNEGSSKRKLPPLGSAERPRPEVTPHVAKILKYGPCPPELLTWYGYVDLDEYLEDTYFRSPEKETDDFDEFPGMTDDSDYESSDNETKIKNSTSNISTGNTLLIPEDSVEKYVPVGKAASSKTIIKSPKPISGVVLGLANLKTWDDIVQKMGKRSYADKGKGKAKV
ncbi:hypothetical protein Tco_0678986 [Tanacetum coccineum]|uniref:Uncharacterized protein n=1 Tax=Tanacetum coccineum TaxID=301880 RepID=A0ABQ4XI20_9ASTR